MGFERRVSGRLLGLMQPTSDGCEIDLPGLRADFDLGSDLVLVAQNLDGLIDLIGLVDDLLLLGLLDDGLMTLNSPAPSRFTTILRSTFASV